MELGQQEEKEGEEGRLADVWALGASSGVASLALLTIKPLKLGLFLRSIVSASSKLVSMKATVCPS